MKKIKWEKYEMFSLLSDILWKITGNVIPLVCLEPALPHVTLSSQNVGTIISQYVSNVF